MFSILISQAEVHNQFDAINEINVTDEVGSGSLPNITLNISDKELTTNTANKRSTKEEDCFVNRVYVIIIEPFVKILSVPKVRSVLRNIGTCLVNGAMEIIAYYLPAPVIPLIASAAGMFIPFEPVVMLKEKNPVANYRRAFGSAINSFLSVFDQYKLEDDDPYMTKRFNRRFMGEPDPITNKDDEVA